MTSHFKSVVARRLAEKKGYKHEVEPFDIPLEPTQPDFLDSVEVPEGTTMFSQVFFSPPDGLPDFPVTLYQDSDWLEEDRYFIPKLDMGYVWPQRETYFAMLAMEKNLKVLTVGPTGSGKTTLWHQIAATVRMPYLRINGMSNMESDTLLGRLWVSNGSMEWVDGELPKALLGGWMIAFDEPWKTPPGIQMALQRFYERDGILQIDDKPGSLKDKQVIPDKRARFVLCDNVVGTGDGMDKYSATMIQDSSTLNRMDIVIKLDYLSPDQEEKMITKRYKDIPSSKAKQIVQLANLIRTGFDQGELSVTLSPRQINTWCEMSLMLRSYPMGFRLTMLERFADDSERSAVEAHYNTVFGEKL